jgi:hypothetical protein
MSDAPDAEACMKFSDYILEEFATEIGSLLNYALLSQSRHE